jgi:hypothetical protein
LKRRSFERLFFALFERNLLLIRRILQLTQNVMQNNNPEEFVFYVSAVNKEYEIELISYKYRTNPPTRSDQKHISNWTKSLHKIYNNIHV